MLLPQIPGFTIRPIRLEDAEDWASYVCLPEVKEHTSSTAATADDVRAVIQRTLAGEHGSPIHFVLLPEGRQTIVGTVGFHTISTLNGTAEITYDVAPAHWGEGIATAACRAAILWACGSRVGTGCKRQRSCPIGDHSGCWRIVAFGVKAWSATTGSFAARRRTTHGRVMMAREEAGCAAAQRAPPGHR